MTDQELKKAIEQIAMHTDLAQSVYKEAIRNDSDVPVLINPVNVERF